MTKTAPETPFKTTRAAKAELRRAIVDMTRRLHIVHTRIRHSELADEDKAKLISIDEFLGSALTRAEFSLGGK